MRVGGKRRVQRAGQYVGRTAGVASVLHHDVAGAFVNEAARASVKAQRNVGQQRAVLAGAGQQKRPLRVHAGVVADVGLVRVARNHHVDAGIEALQNRHDVAAQAGAAGFQNACGGAAAFVQRQHDDVGTVGAQLLGLGVGGIGLVGKAQAGHTRRCHHARRAGQRHADKANGDAHAALGKALSAGGRQQRFSILALHVGRQKAKARAGKRLADLAGYARGELLAAAMLQAQQLAPAPVKFVVADGVEVDGDVVHYLDRRLVQKQRRHHRRRADQIAR